MGLQRGISSVGINKRGAKTFPPIDGKVSNAQSNAWRNEGGC